MADQWPEAVGRVSGFLRQMGVEARIEEFSKGTPTAVDAARAVGSKLSQIVKSLVFDCDGRWVVVLIPGDRRAWDAIIRGLDWQMPVEAETRPRDAQALDRRIALKLRDAGFDKVILLLLNSAHNRRLVASGALAGRYAIDGRSALARLAEGRYPGGSAVVLL